MWSSLPVTFLLVLQLPPLKKTDRHDKTEILAKVELNTTTAPPPPLKRDNYVEMWTIDSKVIRNMLWSIKLTFIIMDTVELSFEMLYLPRVMEWL